MFLAHLALDEITKSLNGRVLFFLVIKAHRIVVLLQALVCVLLGSDGAFILFFLFGFLFSGVDQFLGLVVLLSLLDVALVHLLKHLAGRQATLLHSCL